MKETWKVNNVLTLFEFPVEVDDQLQQQQTDWQEEQQADEEQRKKTVCLFVCLQDDLSQQQGHVSPGATQHLHPAPA